ncbi:unnamed protein product [Toxocara canis]|uniref:DUF148 domain-containing protein n=1 Tax=Toxocara canis TaxID=6265 RepID=A0A183U0Y2_TOXCA|nr:unnamed protein product [Toxocara canis]
MENLSTQSLQDLLQITSNLSLTKQQQEDAIKEWAENQDEQVKNLFMAEMDEMRKMIDAMNKRIDESNMNDGAKEAARKLQAVLANMNITTLENAQQFSAIISVLPSDDQSQLNKFLLEMMTSLVDIMKGQPTSP